MLLMKVQLGPYVLDAKSCVLWHESRIANLPPKAVEFLICMVEHDGAVVSKAEIRERVWRGISVEENSVNQLLFAIRKALKPGFGDTEVIETVPRRGYRLAIPAVRIKAPEALPPAALTAGPTAAGVRGKGNDPAVVPKRTLQAGTQNYRNRWLAGAFLVAAGLILAPVKLPFAAHGRGQPMSFHALNDATDTDEEEQPDVSADGSRVVYSGKPRGAKQFGLFVKIIGGPAPSRVTFSEGNDHGAVWSPDHSLIAFSRVFDDRREIRVVVASEPNPERLILATAATNIGLNWSLDGKWLAYVDKSSPGDGAENIFLVSPETRERRQLTSSTGERYASPQFSPDGRWLAFVRYDPVTRLHGIYRVSASGGPAVPVTDDKRIFRDLTNIGLAWSRDGRDLLFVSDFLGLPRTFRVSAWSGGEPQWIEASGFSLRSVSVSRGTGLAAFTESYTITNIWRVPTSGGLRGQGQPGAPSKPELLLASNRNSHSPRYSPDGSRIAFISDRDGNQELWVASADGAQPVRLTSSGGRTVGSPTWSPDGSQIAYDLSTKLEHPSRSDVYMIGARGGTPIRLTSELTDDHSPAWSRDGKAIYVSSTRGEEREIWRVPMPGGSGQSAASQNNVEQKISHRRYLYYAGKGPFTFWRTLVAGGPEEAVPEILDIPNYRNAAITSRGYYWARRDEAPFESIVFYDFSTRKTRTLVRGEVPLPYALPAMDASPDDKWVIYARTDRKVNRVIVGENFR